MGWYVICFFAALSLLLWLFAQFLRWVWVPFRSKGRAFSLVRPVRALVGDDDLTPDQRDVLGRLTAAFARAGFGPPTTHRTAAVANATGLHRMMVHPRTGDLAVMIVATAKHTRDVVFAVRSEFADGRRISTGVNRNATVFPPNPADDPVSFPWVRDVPTVLEAHRRRVERAGRSAEPRATPGQDQVESYLDAAWDREHAWFVRCGYRYLDAADGKYRSTWKGAYLTAWKLTPPVKGWRARRRARRSRRLWRDLGLDAWQPPPPEPTPALPLPPDNGPTAADPDGGPLQYEAALGEGVVRQQRVADTLTIHVGSPTAGRVLARQWARLLSAAFFTAVLCYALLHVWIVWQSWAGLPVRVRWALLRASLRYPLLLVLLWAGLLTLDVWRVVRAVRSARGPITVVASPAGLQFENLSGRRPTGHWRREDIQGLSVTLDGIGLRGRRYRLDVRPADAGGRRLTLVRARTAAPLQAIRRSIVQAMGMEVPAGPAEATPVG